MEEVLLMATLVNKGRPMTVAAFFRCLFLDDNKWLSTALLVMLVALHLFARAGHHVVAYVMLVPIFLDAIIMVCNFFVAKHHATWGEMSKPVTDGVFGEVKITQR